MTWLHCTICERGVIHVLLINDESQTLSDNAANNSPALPRITAPTPPVPSLKLKPATFILNSLHQEVTTSLDPDWSEYPAVSAQWIILSFKHLTLSKATIGKETKKKLKPEPTLLPHWETEELKIRQNWEVLTLTFWYRRSTAEWHSKAFNADLSCLLLLLLSSYSSFLIVKCTFWELVTQMGNSDLG